MKHIHYLLLVLFMVALAAPKSVARDVAYLQADTVEITSAAMNRSIKAVVIVPHQYRPTLSSA